ncbi:butyrophilin-like protein 2 isoform X1 [Gymnodraco acuticeps]|uniref:Butyrophilin-like protein 2 isoform X1 n=1 Tax=Gymnodraco acuticeps TaxID=8218 RepID=A0A6P8T272_GYMAC|nr:butyrophilin-like protein 2 isoform X1 [Gymnodraco acuticeps]
MKMKALVGFLTLVHVSQQFSAVVSVYEGVESVQLPCQSSRLPEDTTVVWERYDSHPSTVYQHQHQVYEHYLQNQHYSGRTSMSTDALETGDLSLTLKEPQLSDSGVYICQRFRKEEELSPRFTMLLEVKERPTFPPWLYPMLAVCLALAVAALGWYTTITVSSVVVEEGVCFVKLPYNTMAPLPEDVTVEWSPCALEPMRVHEYCNGNNDLVGQDEFYCDRTKMQNELLKTKDLRVNVPQEVVEVGDWAKCVTLPFKTRTRLPADATVKWKRFELSNSWTVHVYQNGQDKSEEQDDSYRGRTKMMKNPLQAGDLSLTLINPSHGDIGAYTCTIERDGDVIWKRSVRLKLKAIGF